ncbi:MAG: Stp1/IreP family PP2C-type Ser/Thr phosphatase [Anaerotignaceae bacterium]
MKAIGNCVTGELRENNEDFIYVSKEEDKLNLYIVADGMGGHNAGEVASKYAVDFFVEYTNNILENNFDESQISDTLVEAISYCNKEIYEKSLLKEELSGMGTTLTCGVIYNNKLIVAHVGDSRAYLFRDGTLTQITKDHSYVMEMVKQGKLTLEDAKVHPNRNIITKAIGSKETIQADVFIEHLKDKDLIMLCSDGLSTMVSDEEITNILNSNVDENLMVEILVNKANENGGKDNISTIVVRFEVEK